MTNGREWSGGERRSGGTCGSGMIGSVGGGVMGGVIGWGRWRGWGGVVMTNGVEELGDVGSCIGTERGHCYCCYYCY